MRSDIKSIIDSYNEAAQKYVEWRIDPNVDIFRREREAICQLLPDVSGCRILDLGCGPGIHTAMLAQHGAKVYGVDLSPRMIEQAKTFLAEHESHPSLIVGDAYSLPFKTSCFDGVVASLLLENLPDIDRPLAEIARVTKQSGFMLYSVNHPFLTSILKIEIMEDKSLRLSPGDYFHKPSFDIRLVVSRDRFITLHLFHRTLSQYINSIVSSGASIDRIYEPTPLQHATDQKLAGIPLVMIIKCKRT